MKEIFNATKELHCEDRMTLNRKEFVLIMRAIENKDEQEAFIYYRRYALKGGLLYDTLVRICLDNQFCTIYRLNQRLPKLESSLQAFRNKFEKL